MSPAIYRDTKGINSAERSHMALWLIMSGRSRQSIQRNTTQVAWARGPHARGCAVPTPRAGTAQGAGWGQPPSLHTTAGQACDSPPLWENYSTAKVSSVSPSWNSHNISGWHSSASTFRIQDKKSSCALFFPSNYIRISMVQREGKSKLYRKCSKEDFNVITNLHYNVWSSM